MNRLNNEVALLQLMALQGWMHVPLALNGKPYGPKWFLKSDWNNAVQSRNRKVTLRLARRLDCIVCGAKVPPGSTGDHMIPKSRGGPDDATNYLSYVEGAIQRKARVIFLNSCSREVSILGNLTQTRFARMLA